MSEKKDKNLMIKDVTKLGIYNIVEGLDWLMGNGLNVDFEKIDGTLGYHIIGPESIIDSNIIKYTSIKENDLYEIVAICELSQDNVNYALNLIIDEFNTHNQLFKTKMSNVLYLDFLSDNPLGNCFKFSSDIYPENKNEPFHIENIIEAFKDLTLKSNQKEFFNIVFNKDLDIASLIILETLLKKNEDTDYTYNQKEKQIFEKAFLKTLKNIKSADLETKNKELLMLANLMFHDEMIARATDVLKICKVNNIDNEELLKKLKFVECASYDIFDVQFQSFNKKDTIKINMDSQSLFTSLQLPCALELTNILNQSKYTHENYKNPLNEVIALSLGNVKVLKTDYLLSNVLDISIKKAYDVKNSASVTIWIDVEKGYLENGESKFKERLNEHFANFVQILKEAPYKKVKQYLNDYQLLESVLLEKSMRSDTLELKLETTRVKKLRKF